MKLNSIDGLRGLAALSVVIFHFFNSTQTLGLFPRGVGIFSQNGLTIFFVLSGFLLWRPFAKSLYSGSTINVRTYLANRFLRIYPAYFAVLASAWLFGLVLLRNQNSQYGFPTYGRYTDPLMAFTGFSLTNTYSKEFGMTGIGPAWSLTAEIAFYLAIPILWDVTRRARKTSLSSWAPSTTLLLVGMLSQLIIWSYHRGMTDQASWDASWGPTWSMVFERSFLAQAHYFGLGMAAATLATNLKMGIMPALPRRVYSLFWLVPSIFALCMIALAKNSPSVQFIFGILFALYLIYKETQGAESRILDSSPVKYLGDISYPLYLVHMPILALLHAHGFLKISNSAQSFLVLALLIALSGAVGSVLHFTVEKPIFSLKRLWS